MSNLPIDYLSIFRILVAIANANRIPSNEFPLGKQVWIHLLPFAVWDKATRRIVKEIWLFGRIIDANQALLRK